MVIWKLEQALQYGAAFYCSHKVAIRFTLLSALFCFLSPDEGSTGRHSVTSPVRRQEVHLLVQCLKG